MQNCVFFLCSLDQFLQKNVIIFVFENQNSKWHSFEKKGYFDLLFTFFGHQERHKNSFSTYLTHIHVCILLTLLTFLPYQFCKNYKFIMYGFSLVWLLVLIFFTPFWNNKITKWWEKFRLECLLLIFIYTSAKFILICKPWTLNDGRWRISSIQKMQKKIRLLSSSHFFLSVKIIIT